MDHFNALSKGQWPKKIDVTFVTCRLYEHLNTICSASNGLKKKNEASARLQDARGTIFMKYDHDCAGSIISQSLAFFYEVH